jgi:hypothetical protein
MNIMKNNDLSRLYDRLERVLDDINEAIDSHAKEAEGIGDLELMEAYHELHRNLGFLWHGNHDMLTSFKALKYIRKPSIDGIGEPTDY